MREEMGNITAGPCMVSGWEKSVTT